MLQLIVAGKLSCTFTAHSDNQMIQLVCASGKVWVF
jgi:hypothetical protein